MQIGSESHPILNLWVENPTCFPLRRRTWENFAEHSYAFLPPSRPRAVPRLCNSYAQSSHTFFSWRLCFAASPRSSDLATSSCPTLRCCCCCDLELSSSTSPSTVDDTMGSLSATQTRPDGFFLIPTVLLLVGVGFVTATLCPSTCPKSREGSITSRTSFLRFLVSALRTAEMDYWVNSLLATTGKLGGVRGGGELLENGGEKKSDIRKKWTIEYVPGNPPSTFRSQSRVVCVVGGIFLSSCRGNDNTPPSDWVEVCVVGTTAWVISITKTPPVEGTSATSPSEVENVERSSCANCHTTETLNKTNQLFSHTTPHTE